MPTYTLLHMRRGQEAKEESLVQAVIGFKVSELGAKLKRVPRRQVGVGQMRSIAEMRRHSQRIDILPTAYSSRYKV